MSRTIGVRAGVMVVAGLAAVAGLTGCDPAKISATAPASSGVPSAPAASEPATSEPAASEPAASEPAASEPVAGPLTVVRPETLGGLPRIHANNNVPTEDSFKTTAIFQGVYGDLGKQDLLFLTALASTDLTPEDRLSFLLKETTSELKVGSYQTVDPGAMGGLVRCGDGTFNGVPAAVCVWSDSGTNGALIRIQQNAAEFSGKVAGLRAEVEKAA